ncbi:MAG TPA: hypothetical protein VFR24_07175 [Candidatus Angelobacter sp.]|nr:hypothetical protein [Candidatus Angelobacter sp.]
MFSDPSTQAIRELAAELSHGIPSIMLHVWTKLWIGCNQLRRLSSLGLSVFLRLECLSNRIYFFCAEFSRSSLGQLNTRPRYGGLASKFYLSQTAEAPEFFQGFLHNHLQAALPPRRSSQK